MSCILGGLGKRSRRGFGSITISKIDEVNFDFPISIQAIKDCLDSVSPNRFSILNDIKIVGQTISKQNRQDEFPWLIEIQIGDFEKSTRDIGKATHEVMGPNEPRKSEYKYAIGAGTPRFASPVIISILEDGRPIMSTLKTVSPQRTKIDEKNGVRFNASIQHDLKNKILEK